MECYLKRSNTTLRANRHSRARLAAYILRIRLNRHHCMTDTDICTLGFRSAGSRHSVTGFLQVTASAAPLRSMPDATMPCVISGHDPTGASAAHQQPEIEWHPGLGPQPGATKSQQALPGNCPQAGESGRSQMCISNTRLQTPQVVSGIAASLRRQRSGCRRSKGNMYAQRLIWSASRAVRSSTSPSSVGAVARLPPDCTIRFLLSFSAHCWADHAEGPVCPASQVQPSLGSMIALPGSGFSV